MDFYIDFLAYLFTYHSRNQCSYNINMKLNLITSLFKIDIQTDLPPLLIKIINLHSYHVLHFMGIFIVKLIKLSV